MSVVNEKYYLKGALKDNYLRITTSKKKILNGYIIPTTVVQVESNYLMIRIKVER